MDLTVGGTRRWIEGWALTIVLASVVALTCTELSDGDLGFHLATGRAVLASGKIPSTNILSYTNPEHPWLLHQWLPAVLFELLYRAHGTLALQALRVLLVAAIWLVAYVGARIAGARPEVAALTTLLAAGAAAFRFQLRPYLFTHLSLALTLCGAAVWLRAQRTGELATGRRALVFSALVPALFAHTHAGVIDSWLVLAALAFAVAIEPLVPYARTAAGTQRERALSEVLAALVASITLAALSLSLYHPYGARVLLFPFDMGSDAYLADHLVEFRPPWRFPFERLSTYWLLIGVAVSCLWLGRAHVHPFHAVAMLGFLLLSLKHARLAFGFALAATPLIGGALERCTERLRRPLLISALSLLGPALVLWHYQFEPPGTGLASRTFPPYLFDYLDRHHLVGKAFVSDAWAGPLLGHSYPAHRAFFDNRFEAYPRAFFVDVYQRIRYGKPGWDALLDRHGVELVLLRYTTPGEAARQGHQENVRQRIARDPRWTLVTFDDLGALFVRTHGVFAAHASMFALPGLDPDRGRLLAPPGRLLLALERELRRGNPSARARALAAQAALAAGRRGDALRWTADAAMRAGDAGTSRLVDKLRARLLAEASRDASP